MGVANSRARRWRAVSTTLIAVTLITPAFTTQEPPLTAASLAQYRLTSAVLERFESASRGIADVLAADRRFAQQPLLTAEIVVAGDVAEAAVTLETRVSTYPSLRRALDTALITPREFTTFALAALAARMAHGFARTGALRVPPGTPAANVAFVEAHEMRVALVLQHLGVR